MRLYRLVDTAFEVLAALSFCHLLNDMMQALLPAMYPMLKAGFHLDFGQVGLITFTFQLTASLLQPVTSLSSIVFPALSALEPAVTLAISSERRVFLNDSPGGVGPRPRFMFV